MTTIFAHPSIERAVEALLKARKKTLAEALKSESIDSLVRSTLQESLQRQVAAGTIGDDVKSAVGYDEYFNTAWRQYQAGTIPESIASELEARVASIPAGE